MAKPKRKKSQRRRNLSYARTAAAVEPKVDPAKTSPTKADSPAPTEKINTGRIDLGFVRADLRRVAILATGCVAVELVLWFLLHRTGLSTIVFGS